MNAVPSHRARAYQASELELRAVDVIDLASQLGTEGFQGVGVVLAAGAGAAAGALAPESLAAGSALVELLAAVSAAGAEGAVPPRKSVAYQPDPLS